MDTLPLITQMFGLIALGALIWLIIRAFKTKSGWGFAVLLLSPFSATVFGIKYWEEQKEPFLLYISTFTATFALCAFIFAVAGNLEPLGLSASIQRVMPGYITTETNNNYYMRAGYSDKETPALIDEPVTEDITKEKEPVRYRLTYIPIKLTEVKNYIGTTAKVKRKNVREKEYFITGASPRYIELAHRSRGGQFSFQFKISDIENIRVLVNEAY
jgi:thiol:disulfide interchange protein